MELGGVRPGRASSLAPGTERDLQRPCPNPGGVPGRPAPGDARDRPAGRWASCLPARRSQESVLTTGDGRGRGSSCTTPLKQQEETMAATTKGNEGRGFGAGVQMHALPRFARGHFSCTVYTSANTPV
eukprot:scaffold751_cov395-Prasinococcus_capsulatus_cf.AAC.22